VEPGHKNRFKPLTRRLRWPSLARVCSVCERPKAGRGEVDRGSSARTYADILSWCNHPLGRRTRPSELYIYAEDFTRLATRKSISSFERGEIRSLFLLFFFRCSKPKLKAPGTLLFLIWRQSRTQKKKPWGEIPAADHSRSVPIAKNNSGPGSLPAPRQRHGGLLSTEGSDGRRFSVLAALIEE